MFPSMVNIKVFHIIVGLDVGGAESMLKRLIESDSVLISRSVVVSLTSPGVIGDALRAQGVRVYAMGMSSALDFPITLWRLLKLVRQFKPDIVQTWMYHADLLGGLAARLAGSRYVIWGIRTTDVRAGGTFATVVVRWICARLSYLLPSAIVCAANASLHSHVTVGYDARKMIVVPNGYDFSWLSVFGAERKILREQCGINSNDVVLGSLGRFHPVKDQRTFVQAAGLLAVHHPQLRFLMVGRGLDWDNTQLVDWIIDTGCKDRFVLLGERKDVPQCLAAMDIFCLHSRTEGFPNVLAEAMAMALPCVTADVGDAALLLADTGVVVPSGDPAALAHGIGQVLSLDPDARCAMGMRSKERVVSEYSIARARERFEEIYRQVLDKGLS
jgi:glycosyltransferase involved in cell wall biosynthesis